MAKKKDSQNENKEVIVKASMKNVDVSPQKLRLVADLIRDKDIPEARDILRFTRKKGARRLAKLLKSAIANAEHNFNLDGKSLYVKTIYIDEGLKLPRYRFSARGRVNKMLKRRSHAVIELSPKKT
jgi:large subunit ribosomal protein L22